MRSAYVLLPVFLLLAACETNVTCNNVDGQIALLKERGGARTREQNKIYKVDMPASTYRVVVEEDVPPGKMTAKQREAKLAAAVKELQDFEEGCGLIEKRDRARWGKRNVIKTHSDVSDW